MPQTTDNCGERSLNSIDWDEDWDENVNLWCQHKSGHTAQVHALKRVHAGPDSSSKLLLAAQLDQLSEVQPAKILAALRDMQTLDGGDLHGCLKWFFEESCPADTNAAFFTALGLIPLRSCYYDTLDAGSQRLLDTILADMRIWFGNQAEHRSFHYPNKFLGDLVCAWLLDELAGKSSSELVKVMHEAADYWRENHWGWGEHMSDCYSGVCLDELSLLLLLARNLPDDLHRKYQQLFDELLSIDDAFGSAPRVPAIRNYDFLKSPIRQTYRSKVVPQDPPPLAEVKNLPLLRPIFHEWGWHKMASADGGEKVGDYTVPCYGGAEAKAWLAPDFRTGGMSRYPIMPNTDHPKWGLSWQSMPAVFWSRQGDWGYWQWESDEGGVVRSHPSSDFHQAHQGNALTNTINPPVVGQTTSLLKNGNMLILRVMPAIPSSWDSVTDRLRIVDLHATIEQRQPLNGWSQLVLRLPERVVAAQCLPLTGRGAGKLPAAELITKTEPACVSDWEMNLPKSELANLTMGVTIWGISVDGEVLEAPILDPTRKTACLPRMHEQSAWELTWRWPGVEWHVAIDPIMGQLVELNDQAQ